MPKLMVKQQMANGKWNRKREHNRESKVAIQMALAVNEKLLEGPH